MVWVSYGEEAVTAAGWYEGARRARSALDRSGEPPAEVAEHCNGGTQVTVNMLGLGVRSHRATQLPGLVGHRLQVRRQRRCLGGHLRRQESHQLSAPRPSLLLPGSPGPCGTAGGGSASIAAAPASASSAAVSAARTRLQAASGELLRAADVAMYRAKAAGKAQAVVFDADMDAGAVERLALESALRGALARDELILHYQPEVDLQTGEVVAMEALLR